MASYSSSGGLLRALIGVPSVLPIVASLFCVAVVDAQDRPQRASVVMDSVPPGTFRGTLVSKDTATSPVTPPPRLVTGTATWRFELDSLDWRRKLTLRIALAGPEHATYVIRTAGSGAPLARLAVRNRADAHSDPRYYMATMSVREMGEARVYREWESASDHVGFRLPVALAPSALMPGVLRMEGYYTVPAGSSKRLLVGSFNARFDPRPESNPRAMTADLQRKILESALWDFTSTWVQHKFHIMPADSVFDAALARTYIRNRFGESVTVDSVSTDYNTYFLRLRGKYVPIVCTVTAEDSQPACKDHRSWRSRLFGAKRTAD